MTNGILVGTIDNVPNYVDGTSTVATAGVTIDNNAAPVGMNNGRADVAIAKWQSGTMEDLKTNPLHVYQEFVGFSGVKGTGTINLAAKKTAAEWTNVTFNAPAGASATTYTTYTYMPAVALQSVFATTSDRTYKLVRK
jgi:hypothetical protein